MPNAQLPGKLVIAVVSPISTICFLWQNYQVIVG